MTWFLAVVLLTAAAMSFLKLALLPRRYAIALALLLAPAALLFQNTLARSSLAEITRQVTGFEALRDWCALLVVQELIACLAAARALRAEADGSKPPLWSYLAWLPSLLLPVGVVVLKIHCFNYFLQWQFSTITTLLAVALPVAGIAVAECARRFGGSRNERIERLFQGELLFVMLGVFLPVAAQAELLTGVTAAPDGLQTLMLLLALAGSVALFAVLSHWIRTIKNQRIIHEYHHANS